MIRKSLIVTGKVQGVGFRFFVKLNATSLNLTGFAKNLDNGDVLIEVQGQLNSIDILKEKLYKGNGFCLVSSISESNLEIVPAAKNSFLMY